MTDEQRQTELNLARRMFAGDTEAARELVSLYRAPLFATLQRMVGDRTEAEDLFQETFLRALRSQANYDFTHSFRAWLFRVGINLARDRIRRRKLPQSPMVTTTGNLPEPAAEAQKQDHVERSQERREMLLKAITTLPPVFKEVIELRYYEGFSEAEISEALGIPRGTVKSRLYHGIRKMRKTIERMES